MPLIALTVLAILLFVIFVTVKLTLLTHRLIQTRENTLSNETSVFPMAIAPPYTLVQSRHGLMLANSNDFYLGKAIIEYGECCEIEGGFLVSLMKYRPGKVIEVGANCGVHSVHLAKALAAEGREMTVFEPQPFVFQNLCANLALSGISNVTAWPWACGAKNEVVYFLLPNYNAPNNFGGVSMTGEALPGNVAVPCVQLDDIVGTDAVSLLKIDVEGYELLALQGAIGVLTRSRPMLYVENDRVEKSQALIEWLWEQNYQLFWHIPPLYNPDNFRKNDENIYGNVASFNMVGVPRELEIHVEGLQEITNALDHILAK
jgi:FkbM family methyltransferase